MSRCNVCRFCGKYDREDEHGLELKAKGADTWALLHDWQIEQFPALAANRAGLYDSLIEAHRSRKERT